MKKLFLLTTSAIFILFGSTLAQPTILGTAVNAGANKVGIYAKTNTNLTNVLFDNIVFCLSIPDQGAGNNPLPSTLAVTSSVSNLELQPILQVIENGRVYYCFNMTDNNNGITSTWTIAGPNPVAEVSFPSNSYFSTMRLEDFSDFGSNGFMSWYVQITSVGQVSPTGNTFFGASDVNNSSTNSFVPLQPLSALSVKLNKFSALTKSLDVNLYWEVIGESSSTNFYEIERSFNGKDFSLVSRVPRTETSSIFAKQYNGIDANILSKTRSGSMIYYRIKEVSFAGKHTYSDVRLIRVNAQPNVFNSNIFPNPASTSSTLNFELSNSQKVSITVRENNGKVIKRFQQDAVKGLNQTKINVNNLSKGKYNVTITDSENNIQTLPLIKL